MPEVIALEIDSKTTSSTQSGDKLANPCRPSCATPPAMLFEVVKRVSRFLYRNPFAKLIIVHIPSADDGNDVSGSFQRYLPGQ